MKPVLETGRLTLIPFNLNDVVLLHQTLTDPFVRKYLMDDETISVQKTKEFIEINEQTFRERDFGLWKVLVKEDNSYAGFAGLWFFFGEAQPQLLYGLLPHNTKEGYATEAATAVIEYAFTALKFRYLIAALDTPNGASRNVCERLGMKKQEEKEINGKSTLFYRLDARSYRLSDK